MAGLPSIFPLVWRIVSFFDSTFGGSFAPSALRASASRRRFTKAPAFVKLFCRLCRPNPAPIKSEIKSNGEINTSTVFCIGYVARRRRNRNPKAGAFVQRLRRFVCAFGASRIRLAEALHESSGFREIIPSAVPTIYTPKTDGAYLFTGRLFKNHYPWLNTIWYLACLGNKRIFNFCCSWHHLVARVGFKHRHIAAGKNINHTIWR